MKTRPAVKTYMKENTRINVGRKPTACTSSTDPIGHFSPAFGIDDVRSSSWKTLLLAPAAFITVVYSPDNDDTEEPTANFFVWGRQVKGVQLVRIMYERKCSTRQNNSSKLLQNENIVCFRHWKEHKKTCKAVKNEWRQWAWCHWSSYC